MNQKTARCANACAITVKTRTDFERELKAFGSAQYKDVRIEKLESGFYMVSDGDGWNRSKRIEIGPGRSEAMDRFMRYVELTAHHCGDT